MTGMNFNIVLRPFRRLQDILTCINLMNIFPNGTNNRERVIAEILKRTRGKETYTREEVAIATEILYEILPRYGDRPMTISENVVEKEVLEYIKESSNVGLRNLFPPVKICCGTALNFRPSSQCIVFEKNSGGVPGLIYTGSCKNAKPYIPSTRLRRGRLNLTTMLFWDSGTL